MKNLNADFILRALLNFAGYGAVLFVAFASLSFAYLGVALAAEGGHLLAAVLSFAVPLAGVFACIWLVKQTEAMKRFVSMPLEAYEKGEMYDRDSENPQ